MFEHKEKATVNQSGYVNHRVEVNETHAQQRFDHRLNDIEMKDIRLLIQIKKNLPESSQKKKYSK